MNKYATIFLLNILMLSISSSSASYLSSEDYNNEPMSERIIKQASQLGFWTVVKALQDGEPINTEGNKYKVLPEQLICFDKLGKSYLANPCYELRLGPRLLRKDQINRIPTDPDIKWIYHSVVVSELKSIWFLTLQYTSVYNLDWEKINTPQDRYWDEKIDTFGRRHYTVNFLLQLLE